MSATIASPASARVSLTPELSELAYRSLRPGADPLPRLALVNTRTEIQLGTLSAAPAESSPLADRFGQNRDALLGSFHVGAIGASDELREAGLLPLLLYLGIREARRNGRSLLAVDPGLAPSDAADIPAVLASLGFEKVEQPSAASGAVWASDVQRAALAAFQALPRAARDWVAENLLTDELEATIRDRAAQFYETSFFKKVFDGTLTRGQYIDSVANNHQFVRWTTRLLGRLVGMTDDQRLRRHFVNHLQGEVDHDTLLENDLRYLGADPEYVRTQMVPCREIQQFMVVQESVIGFHQDPVVAMATPFAIESATAFMDRRFIEALRACITSWGYSTPGRACTFLSSHIHTDGGEDGHWEGTKKMLRAYMREETTLQKALNIANLVMDGVIRAYDAYGRRPSIEHLRSRSV
jgi:hypothetical protein